MNNESTNDDTINLDIVDFTVRLEKDRYSSGKGKASIVIDHEVGYLEIVSSFAYAISRFTGQFKSALSIDMGGHPMPLQTNCTDTKVSEFLGNIRSQMGVLKSVSAEGIDILSPEYLPYSYNSISDGDMGIPDYADIHLNYSVGNGKTSLVLSHSDRLSQETAERFLNTVVLISEGIPSSVMLSDIAMNSEDGIKILESYHGPTVELPAYTMKDMFRNSVNGYPDNVCVASDGLSLTYRQVDEITDRLAAEVQSLGLGKGDYVGFLVPRGVNYLICTIGLSKTGVTYIPFDDEYPDQRIIDCAEDSSMKGLVVTDDTYERAKNLGLPFHIINIDSCNNGGYVPVEIDPEDPLAIIYTSGSTGKPKGVILSNYAFMNSVYDTAKEADCFSDSVYGFFASVGFVANVGMHIMVTAGGTTDIVPVRVRKDIRLLIQYVNDAKFTHTFVTPQVALLLKAKNDTLRSVVVGGEDTSILPITPDSPHIIVYGSTETASIATIFHLRDRKYPESVGFVVRNTKIYILDANGKRVPPGAVGEICFSGPQITKGYLSTPGGRTFITNTFTDEKGFESIFRSGDMGRLLPDRTVGIYGRMDRQVKIRGNRIELSEIDSVIASIPGVKQVTVRAVDINGAKELCAYVVLTEEVSNETIFDAVAARKPSFMVPAFVIRLDALPMNVNNKVDVSKLPKPDIASLKMAYVAPSNEAEKELCAAFSKILGVDKVGIDDDFVRLGGDSLKAMALQKLLSGKVSVADVIGKRTPRKIATTFVETKYACDYDFESGCPFNQPQMNVFLDIATHPDLLRSYIIPFYTEFKPAANDGEVRKALDKIVNAHPILSSRISTKDGMPRMLFDAEPSIVKGDRPKPADTETVASFAYTDHSVRAEFLHTVFDGYSIDVLKDEIAKALSGEDIALDKGTLYSSSFYASVADSELYAESMEFYERVFCDRENDHGLVCSVPDGNKKGSLILDFPNPSPRMKGLTSLPGVSKGTFYTSAFAYAMSRYNGRSDAVFAIAENGRFIPETFNSIGMFVRTLPVCIDCSDSSVESFLVKSSAVINGTIRNGFVPMTELGKRYGVTSNVLMQYAAGVDVFSSLDIDDADISDISVMVIENGDKITLSLKHSPAFTDEFVRGLGETFIRIIEGLITNTALSDIQFTSEEDIQRQDALNATERELRYADVIGTFREHAKSAPNSLMVTCFDKRYTYAEADRITDGIAEALSKKGIGRDDCVAVLVPRSEWYLLAAIGVLKTGAAYVPIDDSYPDERKAFMIADSGAKAVVTSHVIADADKVPKGIAAVCVEDISVGKAFKCHSNEHSDAFAILYTSGTTGKPKGTIVTHLNVLSHLSTFVGTYGITEKDRYASYFSYGFDAAITGLFAPVMCGASVDIVPEDIRLDMDKLASHHKKIGATISELPASVCKLYLATVKEPTLRLMITGGEAIGDVKVPDGLRLEDTYGPTELFDYVTYANVSEKSEPSSIGVPCDNTKLYIVDREMRRLPYGAVGELCVSGLQVTNGYLNRADSETMAFADNPFVSDGKRIEGYGTLYCTGDFARYLPDGTIGFLGRKDSQVKIRGNRVELAEVESVIRSIEGIEDVSVQTVVNDTGEKELCAYVVGTGSDTDAVRKYVSERKPAYMVPSYVMLLAKIPLNVNGKVDKKALPKPDTSSVKEYVSPRNKAENVLCKAFADALGLEKVGIDDDFIALGGDSLKAIRVVSYCRSEGLEISAPDIIAKRTVRSILPDVAEAVDHGSYSGPVAMSPIQRSFMSLGTEKQRNWFNQSMLFESKKVLDIDILQKAVDAVTDHHDMLRAVYSKEHFVRGPGTSVCTVAKKEFGSKEEMTNHMDSLQQSLSLAEGRLMAVSVLALKNGSRADEYLFIAIHHMVVDGASWTVILDDLTAAYDSLSSGKKAELPPRTVSFAEWVSKSSEHVTEKERKYWSDVVSEIDAASDEGESTEFTVSSGVSLKKIAGNVYGMDVVDVLVSSLARSYARLTGKDSIQLRMEGHGRHHANVDRTVGWFTDMYPLTVVSCDDVIQDLYEARKALHSVPNGGISFGLICDEKKASLEDSLPKFAFNYLSTAFVYENGLFRSTNGISQGRSVGDIGGSETTSFNIVDTDDGFVVTGVCASSLSKLPDMFIECVKETIDEITEN